jgi:hypothetical protein
MPEELNPPEFWGGCGRQTAAGCWDHENPHRRQALRDRFIREAGQFTPDNKTTVRTMATGHSPWLSAPGQVAAVLLNL